VKATSEGTQVSAADREFLTEAEIGEGWRLACELDVHSDLACDVPPPPEHPRAQVEGTRRSIAVERPEVEGSVGEDLAGRLGIALDLGTTTVAGTLVDLTNGRVLAKGSVVNRQVSLGADVISRAGHCRSEPNGTDILQRYALESLHELVGILCQVGSASADSVVEAMVAGNAIMLHLLLGVDPYDLAVAPFKPRFESSQNVPASDLRLGASDTPSAEQAAALGVNPAARIITFPIISAYAGGDTVAGIHATDLAREDRPCLLIDLGTNTEVAVGWGGRVVVASAPAGPAFEGAGVRCGSPAVQGAIAHLSGAGPGRREAFHIEVIGEGAPSGICGTGLIDTLAYLRRAGLLDRSGRLSDPKGFQISHEVYLGQADIRELQSAIGAVSAATQILLNHTNLDETDLAQVFLAGSFGAALDPASARSVGLVPDIPLERVQAVGNAAMDGALAALISHRERRAAFQVPRYAEYVELSGHPGFNDAFLEGMVFPDPIP
jgi:uncharacterized 2Fe-2S/4Fe-4S cluster protein (DUF4445 family)